MALALQADYARLTERIVNGPPHLRPISLAVRDHGGFMAIIMQGRRPFELPRRAGPVIALVGDDLSEAHGPEGFHSESLRQLVERCSAGALISSGPDPRPYIAACANAVLLRQDVLIVETRPEQEIPWLAFLRETRPDLALFVCSVRGGTA